VSSWQGPFQSSGIICTHTDFSDQFRSVSTHHSRTAYGHRIWRQLATIFYFSFFLTGFTFPYDTLVFVNVVKVTRQHSHVETYRNIELPRWTFWRHAPRTRNNCLFVFFCKGVHLSNLQERKKGREKWEFSASPLEGEAQWQMEGVLELMDYSLDTHWPPKLLQTHVLHDVDL